MTRPPRHILAVALFCLVAAVLIAVAAWGQAPASGYSARARGYTQSCFQLDNTSAPWTCYPLNEASQYEGKVGAELIAAYEARYGRCSMSCAPDHFFKRWRGPSNEVRFMLADAIAWKYGAQPSDTEITDAQATGDPIWREYMASEVTGFSAEKPEHYNNPIDKCGQQPKVTHFFWGIDYYRFNDPPCGATPTPTPAPTPQPTATPTPTVTPCPVCPPAEAHVREVMPVKVAATLRAGTKALGKRWAKDVAAALAWLDAHRLVYVPSTRSTGQTGQKVEAP